MNLRSVCTAAAFTVVVGLTLVAAPSATAATDPWLDSTFGGGDGTVSQAYAAATGVEVVAGSKTPTGKLVVLLDTAHTRWGCCQAQVGTWALVQLTAEGDLDPTFGADGIVGPALAATPDADEWVRTSELAVDSSGRILISGIAGKGATAKAVVLRRNSDGAPDTTFGTTGRATLGSLPKQCKKDVPELVGMVTQGTKIVVGASCYGNGDPATFVQRLTSTGSIDTTFGVAGVHTLTLPGDIGVCCGGDLEEAHNGDLLISSGSTPLSIFRITAAGSPVTGFATNGVLTFPDSFRGGWTVTPLPDNGFVFADQHNDVLRYTATGVRVDAFDGTEPSMPADCNYPNIDYMLPRGDGVVGLLSCIASNSLFAFDSNGAPVAEYGSKPTGVLSAQDEDMAAIGSRRLVQDGANLLVLGSDTTWGLRVERHTNTGTLDTSYGTGGATHVDVIGRMFSLPYLDAARDHQGRTVTVAFADDRSPNDEGAFFISRFLPDGSPDPSFGTGGTTQVEAGGFKPYQGEEVGDPALVVNPDDSVAVIDNWSDHDRFSPNDYSHGLTVTRLTADGDLDTTTIPTGRRVLELPQIESDSVRALPGPGGTIWVTVTKDQEDTNEYQPNLLRLLPNGTVDTSFANAGFRSLTGTAASGGGTYQLAPGANGSVLLAWREYGDDFDNDVFALAHVSAAGVVDTSFAGTGQWRRDLPAAVLLSSTESGKPLIAWTARLHPDDPFDFSADVQVRRLTLSGDPDTGFGSGGAMKVPTVAGDGTDRLQGLSSSGERPLLLVSRVGPDVVDLIRVTTDGKLDASFGTGGRVPYEKRTQNVIGLEYNLLGRPNGPTTIATIPYTSGDPKPSDAVKLWQINDHVTRVARTGAAVTLSATAPFTWTDPGGPVTVQTASASATGGFGAWVNGSSTSSLKTSAGVGVGRTTCVRVKETSGAVSTVGCVSRPVKVTSLTGAGWAKVTKAKYYQGTAKKATKKGKSLTLKNLRAKTVTLVVTKCPTCGSIDVKWNGLKVKTVSLKGAAKSRVLVKVASFSSVRTGTLTFTSKVTGKPVIVEGVAGWRDDVP